MALIDTITALVAPRLELLGVELVDVEHKGVVVRVVVDEAGGISLDRLAEVTRAVSRALDDADPISTRYTLEVSSPGVERPLRTPRHFQSVIGQRVTFKRGRGAGSQRLTGELVGADDDGIDVRLDPAPRDEPEQQRIGYGEIDKARTVFEWGPPPKPGKGSKPGAAKRGGTPRARSDSPTTAAEQQAVSAAASSAAEME